jgi:hypothetical protein
MPQPPDKLDGKKAIVSYFECSWNTIKKRLRTINDTEIFYYTFAGRPILVVKKYELRYGSPKKKAPDNRGQE